MQIDLHRLLNEDERTQNKPIFLGVEKQSQKSKLEHKGPRALYSTIDMLEVRRACIKERNKMG